MSAASSIKGKQLPVHSVSVEIYSGIARFRCDSTVLVCFHIVRYRLNSDFFLHVKSEWIVSSDASSTLRDSSSWILIVWFGLATEL